MGKLDDILNETNNRFDALSEKKQKILSMFNELIQLTNDFDKEKSSIADKIKALNLLFADDLNNNEENTENTGYNPFANKNVRLKMDYSLISDEEENYIKENLHKINKVNLNYKLSNNLPEKTKDKPKKI